MQFISAGLGSLFLAVNPVMISFMAAAFFGHRVTFTNIISLMLCISGVIIAAIPLIEQSYASPKGLLIMTASMLAYSLGTIYFTNKKWENLHILTINGWQTIIGGIFMFPLLLLTFNTTKNSFDINFWQATLWLAIPVSIGAVLSWLFLLNKTPHTASYWLFLCPLFGFIISNITLHEPVSLYTLAGLILVFSGLFIILRYKRNESNPSGFVISE
jgi:drug/metabolite transporter (DMT)-like permease